MKGKLLMILALAVGIAVFSAPLAAHHGYAAYDTERKVTVKGTVTQWIWANPHCVLQLDATDESGRAMHWVFETENPSTMSRNGWTERSLKVGDQITVTALPLKNGRPVGRIIDVVTSTGQRLAGRVNPATEVKPDQSAKP